MLVLCMPFFHTDKVHHTPHVILRIQVMQSQNMHYSFTDKLLLLFVCEHSLIHHDDSRKNIIISAQTKCQKIQNRISGKEQIQILHIT